MGGEEDLVPVCVRHRRHVLSVEPGLCTRWSKGIARSDMFDIPSGNDSWLGKLLKRDKPHAEGDSQKTAVVDVHFRFSLSKPKNLADSVSRLAPRWFRLLKGVQMLLPHLVQSGGGGNRDGDFNIRLGYGGDDDSDESKGNPGSKKQLLFYTWWAAGVAAMSVLVWALGYYSGIPQRTQFLVSQFVDCVVWLGLAWCLAAVFLWAVRMVVSLTPASQDYRNGWKLFRSRTAFSTGREFVLRSKFDEWMAQNVVAVPGLVISLFLVCDLIHYGTSIFNSINLVARINSEVSRVSDFFNSRVGESTKGASLFSRGSVEKKGRRGTSSSSKRRRS
ncbi:hypothetical protein M758_8G147300 [Ceratodon purpureus]|nr:hypothetical protein M758_8G147300 [Ceratodon purpureus]